MPLWKSQGRTVSHVYTVRCDEWLNNVDFHTKVEEFFWTLYDFSILHLVIDIMITLFDSIPSCSRRHQVRLVAWSLGVNRCLF